MENTGLSQSTATPATPIRSGPTKRGISVGHPSLRKKDGLALHRLVIAAIDEFKGDPRLSPPEERAKVALFLAMRARMGHERAALHHSLLVSTSDGQEISHPRYVVRLDEFYVCEWGCGAWEDYPEKAQKRARRIFKNRSAQVKVSDKPIKLTHLASQEVDTRVVSSMESNLRTYWAPPKPKATSPSI